MTRRPVLVIGGPTASGKSGLALSLAEQISGVVINADSMQVYQGLPLLTAQPSPEEMHRVPHRLYGVLSPSEICSAARWRGMALEEISRAHDGNRIPVIVGGTGFYIKALLQGLSPIPDIPHEYRSKISALQKEMGNPRFHQELAKRDPVMAAKLHPFNTQRLIRAWEVLEATGKSLSEWQELPTVKPPEHLDFFTVMLLPPRDLLYAACNGRFQQMLDAGALEEAKKFKEAASPDMALAKALGYPELSAHLAGTYDLAEAAHLAQQSTRHYAKRQVTWFRHQLAPDLVLERPDAAVLLKNWQEKRGRLLVTERPL